MNKEDVVFKMKTVSNRSKKYFQPVLTNNTKVISAKINENEDKEVICPSRWTKQATVDRIICKDWTQMDEKGNIFK